MKPYGCRVALEDGTVQFRFDNWAENRSLQASVEMELMKVAGWFTLDTNTERVLLYRGLHGSPLGSPDFRFTRKEFRAMLRVLGEFKVPVTVVVGVEKGLKEDQKGDG